MPVKKQEKITVLFIPWDEDRPLMLITIENELKPKQRLVGGLIEPVGLSDGTLYGNEEAKLLGLPINPRATHLWQADQPQVKGWDVFNGDGFITGPLDREGYDTDALEFYQDLASI